MKTRIALALVLLCGCQLPERDAANATFKPDLRSKPGSSAIRLRDAIQEVRLEREDTQDGRWRLSLHLLLQTEGAQREVVLHSAENTGDEGHFGLETEALSEQVRETGLAANFQCTSDSCDSAIARLESVEGSSLRGEATVEHRVVGDLEVQATRRGKSQLEEIKQAIEWLKDESTHRSGRIVLDRVVGTQTESLRAWAQILPIQTQEYVRKVGVRLDRNSEGRVLREELFFSDYHPRKDGSSPKGKWIEGRVHTDMDPVAGIARIRLSAREGEGTLTLKFKGEKLLGAPLRD